MAIPSTQSIRSSEMVSELRPVMPFDLFMAATEGNNDVLVRRLGLQQEEPTEILVTKEASHSSPKQIKTNTTVQSELQSATRCGDTLLHLLVSKGHNELALMVLRRDVSLLKSQNKNLETPLHCAAKVGNEKVIYNLIQIDPFAVKDALEHTNESGDTALHVAAKYGNIDIGLALMKLDPEVAYRVNNNMFSALNVAIDKNYTEMVQTMLEQDRTLGYTQFSTGMLPVHLAASTGNKELVLHLIEKYPDHGELLDSDGRNLFHFAAEENKNEIFEEIFEKTSNREMIARMNNAKDYEGNTPLHIAAMNGHKETMVAIWKNKMNVDAETVQNKQGLTPLQLCRRKLEEYKVYMLKLRITSDTIRKDDIREYVKKEGCKFTKKWFDDIMAPPTKNRWERAQVIGLGSVLITTVTFGAGFTVPGGYNQDNGTPVLGRTYMFRAFILANSMAFMNGFLSLISILFEVQDDSRPSRFEYPTITFYAAASFMLITFGLGMYVTLAPVCLPIAIFLLVTTLFFGTPASIFFVVHVGKAVYEKSNNLVPFIITYLASILFIFCLALM
ncbi:protein ACCELERATED CELL DEATH 6-like [Carex rostrata]